MNAAWPWIRARIIAILLWSVFVIGFSILPLLAVYFFVRFQGERPGLDLLFADGQAFLIISAISADALGRIISGLWSKRTPLGIFQLILLLACIALAVISTLQFMSVLSLKLQKQVVDLDFVLEQSRWFSISALLTGFGGILVIDE